MSKQVGKNMVKVHSTKYGIRFVLHHKFMGFMSSFQICVKFIISLYC